MDEGHRAIRMHSAGFLFVAKYGLKRITESRVRSELSNGHRCDVNLLEICCQYF